MKSNPVTSVSEVIALLAPETGELVRAINADKSTRDSYAGYLAALTGCDSNAERLVLAVCMMECPDVNEAGLKAAVRIIGKEGFSSR